jgi:hypothetical protein
MFRGRHAKGSHSDIDHLKGKERQPVEALAGPRTSNAPMLLSCCWQQRGWPLARRSQARLYAGHSIDVTVG